MLAVTDKPNHAQDAEANVLWSLKSVDFHHFTLQPIEREASMHVMIGFSALHRVQTGFCRKTTGRTQSSPQVRRISHIELLIVF